MENLVFLSRHLWVCVAALAVLAAGCGDSSTTAEGPTPHRLEIPNTLPQILPPAGNPLTEEGIALGRKLFYDPVLSKYETQSCADCHKQPSSFVDDARQFSVGVEGLSGKRNSMALINLMWAKNFFWDGRAPSLHAQALLPIQDPLEMNETLANVEAKLGAIASYREMFRKAFGSEDVTSAKVGLALEQFMATMISGDAKVDKVLRGEAQFTAAEERGRALFFTEFNPASGKRGADCFHCHGAPLFTNNLFMNNGLDSVFSDEGRFAVTKNPLDRGAFKTPTLRNIALTAPYMHDGRFATLEAALEHYSTGVKSSASLDPNMHALRNGLNLTAAEKSDLIAFLKTLTDEAFVNNPKFSKP